MGAMQQVLVGTGGSADPDALKTMLAALEAASKLVCAWYLPIADPDQYLTLNGANAEGWAAAYGTQKVDLAFETAAPQWDATLYSNKGALTFNGTDQRLLGTGNVTNWPANTDDLYMLVALRSDGTGTTTRNVFSYGSSATVYRRLGIVDSTGLKSFFSLSGTTAVGSTTISGSHTVGGLGDIGGTSAVYLDGVSNGTISSVSASLTRTRVRLGAGAAAAASAFWSGAISCAAILNSTASLQDFLDLEAQMRARLS